MRINEMFNETNLERIQKENTKRLAAIKQALDSGKILTLVNASSAPGRVGLGDLRELGYAHKESGDMHGSAYDEYWVVDGDIKFRFDGEDRVYSMGDKTDPITVDRS